MQHEIILWGSLILTGIVAGSYSSVVGGAAFVLVPLLTLLGLPLLGAIATMRASAVIPQGVCVIAFQRKTKLDWGPALWFSLFAIPGGYFGAHIALSIDQRLLSDVVGVLLILLLACTLKFDRQKIRVPHHVSFAFYPVSAVVGFLLGLYGGFYGAAFSTMVMFFFILSSGQSFLISSGNASIVTMLLSLAATYPFIQAGLVSWNLAIPLTVGLSIGSWEGVNLAARYGTAWIKILLTIVIVASVIKLFFFS